MDTKLLTIGKVAKETGELVTTIRYWLTTGLLEVAERTPAGYQLFDRGMVEKGRNIRQLQKEERLTLNEIKERINNCS